MSTIITYMTLYDDLKRELINELQLSHKIETHIKGTCISYINKLQFNSDASLKLKYRRHTFTAS